MKLGTRVIFTNKTGGYTGVARDGETCTIAAIFRRAYTVQFTDGFRMYATSDELEET